MTRRLSPAAIAKRIDYDPATGLFRWKRPTSWQATGWFKGSRGLRQYRRLWIRGRHYLAHVVAYALMKGRWPRFEIGHRNRDHGDNRWQNLRHRTPEKRGFNRRINRNNATGFRGVSLFGDHRFRAVLRVKKRQMSLGLFDSKKDAATAWRIGARRAYGTHYHE